MYVIDDNMLRVYKTHPLVGPVLVDSREYYLRTVQNPKAEPSAHEIQEANLYTARQAERLMRSLGGG